jgi:hypothetical protein
MAGKRTNVLRDYHLLIKREADGFEWQIRYDRHANAVQRSQVLYGTHEDAAAAGDKVLATLKREASDTR